MCTLASRGRQLRVHPNSRLLACAVQQKATRTRRRCRCRSKSCGWRRRSSKRRSTRRSAPWPTCSRTRFPLPPQSPLSQCARPSPCLSPCPFLHLCPSIPASQLPVLFIYPSPRVPYRAFACRCSLPIQDVHCTVYSISVLFRSDRARAAPARSPSTLHTSARSPRHSSSTTRTHRAHSRRLSNDSSKSMHRTRCAHSTIAITLLLSDCYFVPSCHSKKWTARLYLVSSRLPRN